jgi:hypothetical protein
MSGMLFAVGLLLQDPFQNQIDDALRRFEAAAEIDQALTLLSSQLMALGAQATNPIARRLAEDLRDGMASAAAPAFIDALVGRPDALAPLQSAFRDAATTAAGRIELAEALLQLDDAMSWRAGLLAIASDEQASVGNRLHAAKVLLEAEDPQVPVLLHAIVEDLHTRPEAEQRQVVEFLVSANSPLARELLETIAADERLTEATRRSARVPPAAHAGAGEPRARIIRDRLRPPPEPFSRPAAKKKETRGDAFFTMPSILAGGVTLVLLVLLIIEILRKG